MASIQLICPHCGSTVTFGQEVAAGTAVECLICMRAFAAQASEAPRPKPSSVKAKPASTSVVKAKAPAASPKAAAAIPQPKAARQTEGSAQGGNGAMIAIVAFLLVLVAGGVGFAVWKMSGTAKNDGSENPAPQYAAADKPKDTPEKKEKTPEPVGEKPDPVKKDIPPKNIDKKPGGDDDDPDPVDIKKKPGKDDGKGTLIRKDPPKFEDKQPEIPPVEKVAPPEKLAKPIPGLDAAMVNGAVDRGVAYLKRSQQDNGSWSTQRLAVGYASFAGLTLLECKTPAADPSVQLAAAFVRAQALLTIENYEISTAILFLDRLGDPKDRSLIQSLAIRLLCSQNADGSWGYRSLQLEGADTESLLKFLQSHKQPNGKAVSDRAPIQASSLSPYLQGRIVVQNQGRAKGTHFLKGASLENGSDHSNTQFALLALWAARRHEVPTDYALLSAFQRFAMIQNKRDGGWAYTGNDIPGADAGAFFSTNTMTCVGLLALALGHGVSPEYEINPKTKERTVIPATKDPRINFALLGLARWVGQPVAAGSLDSTKIENHYFLWSVERIGVLYALDKIGDKEWYGWGAQILVSKQNPTGEWTSIFYPGSDRTVDTCFALLFLKRSNLVHDLTTTLKLNVGIRDSGK